MTNLLFDLDGTLTDPREGILNCIRHALASLRPGVLWDDAELLPCIGPPLRESFAHLLCTEAVDEIERAVTLYRERYGVIGLFENVVYADIEPALESLQATHTMFVATSKPTEYAVRILERFGLSRFFKTIHGCHMDGHLGTKPELIGHLLDVEKIDRQDTVMIGDRKHDVLGAAAHGIPCIGVLWGYGSDEELLGAGAATTITSPREIASAVAALRPRV